MTISTTGQPSSASQASALTSVDQFSSLYHKHTSSNSYPSFSSDPDASLKNPIQASELLPKSAQVVYSLNPRPILTIASSSLRTSHKMLQAGTDSVMVVYTPSVPLKKVVHEAAVRRSKSDQPNSNDQECSPRVMVSDNAQLIPLKIYNTDIV
ncbi:hypothetical protein HAX54_018704, partial [Datura stramonium]|nr:hypothetical protein [Datura stramonium]